MNVRLMSVREGYLAAAAAFADLVEQIGDVDREGPGLGDWTLRDLVGHTVSSGLNEVVTAVHRPAETAMIHSAEAYYALARQVDPDVYTAAVAASGEDARRTGADLGTAPSDAVRGLVAEVGRRLPAAPPTVVVTTAAGGMVLDDWLPTRTFELTVHGFDIASLTAATFVVPDDVLAQAVTLAARIAVVVGDGPDLLRAMTGRGTLAEGFSVV
jgi:hypothetical protein